MVAPYGVFEQLACFARSLGRVCAVVFVSTLAPIAHLHLGVEVEGHVGEGLLDVANDLALGGGGEAVAALGKDLHQVVCDVATGEVETADGVGERVALVDRNGVGDCAKENRARVASGNGTISLIKRRGN